MTYLEEFLRNFSITFTILRNFVREIEVTTSQNENIKQYHGAHIKVSTQYHAQIQHRIIPLKRPTHVW